MPDIIWLIAIGLIASGLFSMVGRAQARAARQRWTEAAQQLGFAMVGTGYRGLSMTGSDGVLRAMVDVSTRGGSRRSSSSYTRYRVEYPSLGLELRLSKEGSLHGILKTLGDQDVEIGHDKFDDTFFVKADNEDRARRYFTPQRIASLNALAEQHPGVIVTDDEIRLETKGMANDTDRIVATMNQLMAAARVLATVEPGEAEPEPEQRDVELQRIFEPIEEYEEEEIAEAGDVPPTPAAGEIDQLRMSAHLFGDQKLGFETERRFEQEYQGRTVDWTGVVQRSGGLSSARRFDGEDHQIVEINIASLEDDLYGTTAVDAVVAFAPGTSLPERGKAVQFSGRLIAIDALTKDVYVADGRLSSAAAR